MVSDKAPRRRLAFLFLLPIAFFSVGSEASSATGNRRLPARNVQETFHRRANTDTLTFSGDVDKIVDMANAKGIADREGDTSGYGDTVVVSVEPPPEDETDEEVNEEEATDPFDFANVDILGAATKAPTAAVVQTPVPGLIVPAGPSPAVSGPTPQSGGASSPSSAPALATPEDGVSVFYVPTKAPSAPGATGTVSIVTTATASYNATSTTNTPTASPNSSSSSGQAGPSTVGAGSPSSTTQESTGSNPQPTGTGTAAGPTGTATSKSPSIATTDSPKSPSSETNAAPQSTPTKTGTGSSTGTEANEELPVVPGCTSISRVACEDIPSSNPGAPSSTLSSSPASAPSQVSSPTTQESTGVSTPSSPTASVTSAPQKGTTSPVASTQPGGVSSPTKPSPVAFTQPQETPTIGLSSELGGSPSSPTSQPVTKYPTPLFLTSNPVAAPSVEASPSAQKPALVPTSEPKTPSSLVPSRLPTVTTKVPVVSAIVPGVTKSPSVDSALVDSTPTTNAAQKPTSVTPSPTPSTVSKETATVTTPQADWTTSSPISLPMTTSNPTAVPGDAPSSSVASPTVQGPTFGLVQETDSSPVAEMPTAAVSISEAPFSQGWTGNISDPVTPDSIVASCSDVSLERAETIDFMYSLETIPDMRDSLENVRRDIEIALSRDIANLLLPCEVGLEPLGNNELGFEGIDYVPEDIISEASDCDAIVDIKNDCTVFDGILTIYISPEADFELARYYTLTAIRESISLLDSQIGDLAKATYLGPEIVNPSSFAGEEEVPGGIPPGGPNSINASVVLFAVGGCAFAASIGLVYYLRRHGTSSSGAATQAAGSDQYTGGSFSRDQDANRPLSPFSEMLPSAYRFDADGNMSAILELDDESATQRSGVVSDMSYTTGEDDTITSMDKAASLNHLESPRSMLGARKRYDASMDSLLELM